MTNYTDFVTRIEEPLSSLDELADEMFEIVDKIKSKREPEEESHFLLGILASRGSLPFLNALEFLVSEGIIDNGIDFRVIPHIISIENLLEIVMEFGSLGYKPVQSIIEPIFTEYAKGFSEKVYAIAGTDSAVLTDWDEVNTGSNIVQRIKMYNQFDLPPGLQFFITSFIGSGTANLKSSSINGFNKHASNSPQSFHYIDVIAQGEISWSDNEDFFSDIGIVYPGIAAPNATLLRDAIKASHVPDFYRRFFRYQSAQLAACVGIEDPIEFKLLPLSDPEVLNVLEDDEIILQTSRDAYIQTLRDIEEVGGIKHREKRINGRFEIDTKKRVVYHIGRNGKTTPALFREKEKSILETQPYRNPFVLFYDTSSEKAAGITHMLEGFFEAYRKNGGQTYTP